MCLQVLRMVGQVDTAFALHGLPAFYQVSIERGRKGWFACCAWCFQYR
jgi:hypothetical protein